MATKIALAAIIPLTLAGSLWVALPAAETPAANPPPAGVSEARFRVGTQVINPGLEAFTATTGRIGNTFLRNGGYGFEPVQLRNRFSAAADGENSITIEQTPLTGYDSHRQGLYDDAEVLVFRITEGKFRLVRSDRVAVGGHKAGGWNNKLGGDQLLPPTASTWTGGLETWSRPEAPYWFALVSVDKQGLQSAPSTPVLFERTATEVKKATDEGLIVFKSQRGRNAPKSGEQAGSLPAPTGLNVTTDAATGQPAFTWTPVGDPAVVGYRLLRSDLDPATHEGYRLDLAGKAANADERIKTGDMIVVRKELSQTSRRQHFSNRIYDSKEKRQFLPEGIDFQPDEDPALAWSLERHPADSPVVGGGQTAARFDIRDGREFAFAPYAYGPSGQHWWPTFLPDRDYAVEFWAKADKPLSASFALTGFYEPKGKNPVAPATFALTTAWQRFTHIFRVPVRYDGTGSMGGYKLAVTGPATLWIDNVRLIEAGTPYAALTPDDAKMFGEARVSAIRTHAFIKTGITTYSMEQLLAPAGAINGTQGNTVPQTLAIMEQVKARPWLQIEMHMAPEEWKGLVEYLAAPYDPAVDTPASKPWAARRHAQGRTRPWSESFDRMYFEISNETWNSLFGPWNFMRGMKDSATGAELDRGTVYGLFQEWVIDQLSASPWWKQAGLDRKVEFVIGGWGTQTKPDGSDRRCIQRRLGRGRRPDDPERRLAAAHPVLRRPGRIDPFARFRRLSRGREGRRPRQLRQRRL